jgi:hypothetical protein
MIPIVPPTAARRRVGRSSELAERTSGLRSRPFIRRLGGAADTGAGVTPTRPNHGRRTDTEYCCSESGGVLGQSSVWSDLLPVYAKL